MKGLYHQANGALKARARALVSGIGGNLGRCGFCMRTSFGAAALSWMLLLTLARFAAAGVMMVAASGIAIALTTLWLAHLLTYASRATRRVMEVDRGRRHSLLVFARMFGIAAAATALPAALARAQGQCLACVHTFSCLDRNGRVPCCPDTTPYLCTTDCKCYDKVDACSSTYQCTGQ
jgi:hypothetical protein